jgi:hypothetical protein
MTWDGMSPSASHALHALCVFCDHCLQLALSAPNNAECLMPDVPFHPFVHVSWDPIFHPVLVFSYLRQLSHFTGSLNWKKAIFYLCVDRFFFIKEDCTIGLLWHFRPCSAALRAGARAVRVKPVFTAPHPSPRESVWCGSICSANRAGGEALSIDQQL